MSFSFSGLWKANPSNGVLLASHVKAGKAGYKTSKQRHQSIFNDPYSCQSLLPTGLVQDDRPGGTLGPDKKRPKARMKKSKLTSATIEASKTSIKPPKNEDSAQIYSTRKTIQHHLILRTYSKTHCETKPPKSRFSFTHPKTDLIFFTLDIHRNMLIFYHLSLPP